MSFLLLLKPPLYTLFTLSLPVEKSLGSLWDAGVSLTPAVGGEERGPLGPLSCAHGGLASRGEGSWLLLGRGIWTGWIPWLEEAQVAASVPSLPRPCARCPKRWDF